MGTKWNSTKYPGVRYRSHPSRKHGVQKDKYFVIRYQKEGKRKEEGLGWSSDGWSAQKAAITLANLKNAYVTGEGPTRLSEKREISREDKERKEAEKRSQEADAVTYGRFFVETYFPGSKADKSKKSWLREDQFHRLWVSPVIGEKSLKKVSPLDLERIKKNMADTGRAPRTIHYCLATIRQVFNKAKVLGLYKDDNPISKVKKPKVDNRRLRFLTLQESDMLLEMLKSKSQQLHDMALLSLHCGLRAGEIFNLCCGDVDLEKHILIIRDSKAGQSRPAFMTDKVKEMLSSYAGRGHSDLVFTDRDGKKIREISNTFSHVINELGLNDGVTDKRYKVVFHTLRHTYASLLVENGTDLYTVKALMGHNTLSMTERYSHLSNASLQRAVRRLERKLNKEHREDSNVENGVLL